jgi:tight adherence protein C
MILLLLIGLGLVAASVALLLRALAMPRARTTDTLGRIAAYGFASSSPADEPSPSVRSGLDSLASTVGRLLGSRLQGNREQEIRRELMAAGLYAMPVGRFMGYRLLCAACAPVAVAWGLGSAGVAVPLVVMVAVLAAVGGWVGPITAVRNRARRRLAAIDYALPELIDLLVVTVEAGLGFNGSMQVAATRIEGPLGDELRLTMQEQSFGLASTEALANMLTRCDTPGMRSFVRAVLQGEALGVSIGQIMRNLAGEMRNRRRQNAEERAQKAPIKILFPLIFLIFPAMFIVLLVPAVFMFLDSMAGR